MASKLSRREFLNAAGGVSLLTLVPIGNGFFAIPGPAAGGSAPGAAPLPTFTAVPYIQPGPGGPLADGKESMVVAWQTDATPAQFTVEYGTTKAYGKAAQISTGGRTLGGSDRRLNYHALLTGLPLAKRIEYRVSCSGATIAEGYFTTRKPRGTRMRFVSFGDNCCAGTGDLAIAYYSYKANPDFVMNTGDNVYEKGLDSEYASYFYPVYNADVASPTTGAPLLRSVPFYTVIANHDVADKDENRHPIADFSNDPDSLAYFTAMHLPLNGPVKLTDPPPTTGPADVLTEFQACAGDRWPRMANYSFDYGDIHFLCLDSNIYVNGVST